MEYEFRELALKSGYTVTARNSTPFSNGVNTDRENVHDQILFSAYIIQITTSP